MRCAISVTGAKEILCQDISETNARDEEEEYNLVLCWVLWMPHNLRVLVQSRSHGI